MVDAIQEVCETVRRAMDHGFCIPRYLLWMVDNYLRDRALLYRMQKVSGRWLSWLKWPRVQSVGHICGMHPMTPY